MFAITRVYPVLLLAGTLASMNNAAAQSGGSPSVSYSLVETGSTVREPVFLRVAIENYSDEAVTVDLGISFRGSFRARMLRPDGRIETAPKPSINEFGPVGKTVIAPHERFSEMLLLNLWFDFDLPGRYFLDIVTTAPFVTASGIQLAPAAAGGSVTIRVAPRDQRRLRQICADLETKVRKSASSSAAALEAAETLSYIRDPVATPYLARLFDDHKNVEPLAVYGLERVADGPAVDALISQMNSREGDMRILAPATLRRMQEAAADPVIRQKIEEALR